MVNHLYISLIPQDEPQTVWVAIVLVLSTVSLETLKPLPIYPTQSNLFNRRTHGIHLHAYSTFHSDSFATNPTYHFRQEKPMNNKLPLSSIFDGKDHNTFVSINLALQALQLKGTPVELKEITEQALIELLKVAFNPNDLN